MTATETKRQRGRPRSDKSRRVVLPTRLHDKEASLIERAARKAKMERTEWMRQVLVNAAQAA